MDCDGPKNGGCACGYGDDGVAGDEVRRPAPMGLRVHAPLGALSGGERVFRGKEVVPRNHRDVARVTVVRVLATPAGTPARGDKEAERSHAAAAEQLPQFGELVAAGVTDPDTDDYCLGRIREGNRFCDLRQR